MKLLQRGLMHAAAGWVPAAQSNSTLQHRGDTFFFFFPFSFFFVSLPLYFRFNFSLFVAAPANGDAGGRGEGEEGALHGADRKLHERAPRALPSSFFQLDQLLNPRRNCNSSFDADKINYPVRSASIPLTFFHRFDPQLRSTLARFRGKIVNFGY